MGFPGADVAGGVQGTTLASLGGSQACFLHLPPCTLWVEVASILSALQKLLRAQK